ncbi:MAG: hypothetical protein K2X38_10790 [Gemmataceae bacterium]|nr:hypothetical protein [Gemmataceae bacterium]
MTVRLVILALLLVAAPWANADAPWKAGAGKVVITPDRPMWMSGYGARTKPAEGKSTELYAKALMLETEGGNRAVLVTLDRGTRRRTPSPQPLSRTLPEGEGRNAIAARRTAEAAFILFASGIARRNGSNGPRARCG